MAQFILGLLLAVTAIVLWAVLNVYKHVPAKELKRMARSGDAVAGLLYRPVAYGVSLQVLLKVLIGIASAAALVSLQSVLGIWLALLVLLVIGFAGWIVVVPSGELTKTSLWIAKRAAPIIAWLLERAHPVIDYIARFVSRHQPVHFHTGLYQKSDLVELLELQKSQPDSRISGSEIGLLQHALSFGDKLVSDALVPKRVVKIVSSGDSIGPILMDELSKSGHSRFPVYSGTHDNIVGVLYLHDLVGTKQTGKVEGLMSTKLTYVHEDFTLYQALQAFLKTKRHLFIVVNGFEEFVGVLTIEDVIEQMIGRPIVDEFDRYDDLRAVAAAAARKDHTEHKKANAEPGFEGELELKPEIQKSE